MYRSDKNFESGQSMVIIAVLLVVLIGLSALVLDGGLGYAKRRQAQNAADAAALAGADVLCSGGGVQASRDTAREYLLKNGASEPAESDIIITNHEGVLEDDVIVNASVTHPTFFAGIFGSEEITARATAQAGCFIPCNAIVLPIAWACHPPIGEDLTDHCEIEYADPNDDTPPLYLVMDSVKLQGDTFLACKDPETGLPANGLECDTDGDGINDILYGGERSWIDLNGGGGGQLLDWIASGFSFPLVPHMWFGSEDGTIASVIMAIGERTGETVVLPVYDAFCDSNPEVTGECPYHDGPPPDPVDIFPGDLPWFEAEPNASQTFFHVISYSYFKITCVEEPGNFGTCPGKAAAQEYINTLYDAEVIKDNTLSVEGYFVEEFGGSGACDGTYAGVYTLYLK